MGAKYDKVKKNGAKGRPREKNAAVLLFWPHVQLWANVMVESAWSINRFLYWGYKLCELGIMDE
jgi:hypothetical protein